MAADKMKEILKHFPDLEEGWKEMEEKLKEEPAEREMLSLKYREMLQRESSKESLPEPEFTKAKRAEPAGEDMDLGCGVIWKDVEPVSDDLEKAAERYAIESYPDEPSTGQFGTGDYEPYVNMSGQRECAVEDFKAGANWQKQQLMKDAVECEIAVAYDNNYGGYTQLVDSKIPLVTFGQKVKLIIIKED